MQTFNLHTHTRRCGHADGTDCQYIEKAIEAGFTCLGFSDHIQYKEDNGKYGRINFEEYPLYFSDLKELKEKYKDQITILSGLEAAYVPEVMDEFTELSKYCDFILLGQHQGGLTKKKYCLNPHEDFPNTPQYEHAGWTPWYERRRTNKYSRERSSVPLLYPRYAAAPSHASVQDQYSPFAPHPHASTKQYASRLRRHDSLPLLRPYPARLAYLFPKTVRASSDGYPDSS